MAVIVLDGSRDMTAAELKWEGELLRMANERHKDILLLVNNKGPVRPELQQTVEKYVGVYPLYLWKGKYWCFFLTGNKSLCVLFFSFGQTFTRK